MADKKLNGRIINKHDTETNWNKATGFIPLKGEVIIYDIDSSHNYERIKVGDGVTVVSALPFYAGSWNDLKNIPSAFTPADHDHDIADVSNLQTTLNSKVPTTRTVNGKALSVNITLSASDVGADESGAANTALNSAKAHTDAEIKEWVGTETVAEQISDAVANKVDKVSGKGLSTNDYTTAEKNKLTNIASGAEVNQNAFSNIAVGNTTIAADSKTDTLTITAGDNVTITPDATNDKITIAAKDTVYTHPTYTAKTSGLYKVTVDGTGHVSGTAAVVKNDITALGIPAQDTTYSAATTDAAGLMSASDKTKLDGIATGANKITVDSALSSSSTNPVQNKAINAAISNLNTAISGKADDDHTHTAAEVGADASGAAASALNSAKSYTDTKISALINSAPTTLDTLGEIADAMEENADVVEALESAVGTKANVADLTSHTGNTSNPHSVTKAQVGLGNVENKSSATIRGELTKANVTTALGYTPPTTDTVYTHPSYTARTGVPTANAAPAFGGTFSVSQPVSDATGHITALNSRTITIPSTTATTSAAGLMSATDKVKLDGIATGANKTTVDAALSSTSTNPVQNKVVNTAIDNLNTLVGTTAVADQISTAIAAIDHPVDSVNGQTGAVVLDADDVGALPLSGGKITGTLHLNNSTQYPELNFWPSSLSGAVASILSQNPVENGAITRSTFSIKQRSYETGTTNVLSKLEMYSLPRVDPDRTTDAYYSILTTKSPVTIEQGGTGATTAAKARENLGVTPENIGALPLAGGTITGPIIVENSAFSNGLTIKRTGTNGVGMRFMNDNGLIGILGMTTNGKLQRYESDGTTSHAILDDTGGTLTGHLIIDGGTESKILKISRTVNDVVNTFETYIGSNGSSIQIIFKKDNVAVNKIALAETNTSFDKPVTIASGGTGASTAAAALRNLGVIYSKTEPAYQEGAIWLKPIS